MTRKSFTSNEVLQIVLDNCKEFLQKRDTIYLFDAFMILSKALEGVENKKDLTESDKEAIKKIRNLIKGL